MAGYRANNAVVVVAILVIVLLAAIVLYVVFGGRYTTNMPPAPAPVVPDVERRVELPRVETQAQSPQNNE